MNGQQDIKVLVAGLPKKAAVAYGVTNKSRKRWLHLGWGHPKGGLLLQLSNGAPMSISMENHTETFHVGKKDIIGVQVSGGM